MGKLRDIEDNIKDYRRRCELDQETYDPDTYTVNISFEDWQQVLADPYLLVAFPDPEARENFVEKKKIFGVQIVVNLE